MNAEPFPDDVEALKALVLAQQALLSERAVEIEHLKLVIAKLKRLQFGRRSEKLDQEIEQLELRLEELRKFVAVGIEQADRAELAPLDVDATLVRVRSRKAGSKKEGS